METLTTNQVVEILKIGENQVRELAATGELPCMRIGKRFVYARADIEAWIRRQIDEQTEARRNRMHATTDLSPTPPPPRRRGRGHRNPIPEMPPLPELVGEV